MRRTNTHEMGVENGNATNASETSASGDSVSSFILACKHASCVCTSSVSKADGTTQCAPATFRAVTRRGLRELFTMPAYAWLFLPLWRVGNGWGVSGMFSLLCSEKMDGWMSAGWVAVAHITKVEGSVGGAEVFAFALKTARVIDAMVLSRKMWRAVDEETREGPALLLRRRREIAVVSENW